MDSSEDQAAGKRRALEAAIELLKAEERRYRFLSTATRTSPEFRREAMARLQGTRERLYASQAELRLLFGGDSSDALPDH